MEATGTIVLMAGTRVSKDVIPPVGVGMVAKIGDRSALAVPTVMGVVPQVMIVEVEAVTIIRMTDAIGECPRLPLPPATQRAKRAKRKASGSLHSLHQGMSQHRGMMMFPWHRGFLRPCGLSARSGSRSVMKRMNGGGSVF